PGPASPLFWSLLLYVLYLIGLAWSDDMGYAWFDLGIKASMGLLPLVLWAVPDDRRVGGRTVLGAFVAGASIAVVICVLVALARTLTDVLPGGQGFWAGQWIGSRFSLFMHPTYFAVHLCLALVVVLLREARPGDRGYRRITPWLLVAGVLFCGSKAGWIVLVLLYGLLLLMRWRTPLRRSLLLAGLAGAVAFAVFMAVSPYVREKVEQLEMLGDHAPVAPDASGSTGLRQLTWTAAMELLQENWLLGTGTGDVKNELLARYAEKGYVHALEQRLNAHSQLLQTPLTVGVVGGVLIALLLAVPAWSAIRRRDALMVAFVLVLGINWAFESMLEVQAGVVFLTVAGLMLALRGPSTGGSGPRMVMLTQYYPPETGAPQNRLHATAMGLADLGMEVTVLTGMPNYPDMKVQEGYRGAWYRQELIDGIDVRRSWLYVPMGKGIFPRLANYFSFVMSAWWTGSAELRRSDVLLVESPPLFLGITAMLLARATGASLVFNVSDLWPESAVQLGLVRNQLLIGASTGLEELCYRRSALITGQTRGIVADIERRMPDKEVHWLPNGVDLPTMQALPVEPGMRAHFGIPAGAMVCLYGGIIGHAQGLETVVAAAEELRDEPGVLFLLVGEGPVKSELQDLVGRKGLENVRFLDRMPRASVLGLLKECDAVVVPLRRNDLFKGAIPSKIFEALALGKPLLLGVDGEARDLFIRDGECGTFVEPEDPVALAEAVRRYRDDPALRAAHGANGLRYVKAHFDRAVITHGLWVALQEVLARRSARR
ncbi:MAG: glycosyltransferase, partial [Flavobacteriales bacterium]|nr:glycosyltransferase [Flavobacteriales bacterium]